MSRADPGGRARSTWPAQAVLLALLVVSAACVLYRLGLDLAEGGNDWRQGDWLINSLHIPTRRGPFGSAILMVSDVLEWNPLTLVAVIQAGLVIALYGLAWVLLRDHAAGFVALALITSPALFVLFWPADPQGSLRKELIVFVALLGALLAVRRGSLAGLTGACALFVVAAIGHEANALFLPLLLYLLLREPAGPARSRGGMAAIAVTLLLTAAAVVYAVTNRNVADAMPVCLPLLERGVRPEICTGAIDWLIDSAADGAGKVGQMLTGSGKAVVFPLVYCAAMANFAALAIRSGQWRKLAGPMLLSALPFLPLYPITLDWGRWMSLHAFSLLCIFVQRLDAGEIAFSNRRFHGWLAALSVNALLWAPEHMGGIVWGGATRGLLKAILATP